MSKTGVKPLSTVLKTLEVMHLFANRTRSLKLTEIASYMDWSPATTYQRLITLIAAGWLEQDDGRYRLSMLATRLATAALEQADFGKRSITALSSLAHSVNETASLAVLERGVPCIIARVETDSLLRAELKIGAAMSLELSASGRVLVAFADEATLQKLMQGRETLPADDVLADVRRKGFAISSGETQSGVIAIAAPVFDADNQCRAAVSLVMPEARFNLKLMQGPVTGAAAEISHALHGGNRAA